MLLKIQTYIEDYFYNSNFQDYDGYALFLASLFYELFDKVITENDFKKIALKENTTFFKNNEITNKEEYIERLLTKLIRRYKKKDNTITLNKYFEKEILELKKSKRISLKKLLTSFCIGIESKGIDQFWISRKKNILQSRPEKIGQANLSIFTLGIFIDREDCHVFREFGSGIGFVDVGIMFSSTLHIIEIKILTDNLNGFSQLEQYMKNENRKEGTLLIFDARPTNKKIPIQKTLKRKSGKINTFLIDINPTPPSSLINY